MDWLTFIAEIVDATAWPIMLLVVFLVLRRQLIALLPGLQRLKWKDFEAEFSRKVQEVAAEARDALPQHEMQQVSAPSEEFELMRLAEVSPRAAILEAWIALEGTARTALTRMGASITAREMEQPARLAEALISNDFMNPSQADVLKELRRLRNAAAHATDPKVTVDDAQQFVKVASALERLIRFRMPDA